MDASSRRRRRYLAAAIATIVLVLTALAAVPAGAAAVRTGQLQSWAPIGVDGDPSYTVGGQPVQPANATVAAALETDAGETVTVQGWMSDGLLISTSVAGGYQRMLPVPPPASAPRRVAVILADYGDPNAVVSSAAARKLVFDDLNAYLQEVVHTTARLVVGDSPNGSADVFGPYVVPNLNACAPSRAFALTQEVAKATEASGPALRGRAAYQDFIVILPTMAQCRLRGVEGGFGNNSFGTRDANVGVIAHEYGHLLGLRHAGGINCRNAAGTPIPLAGASGSCTPTTYSDPFDDMGNQALYGVPVREYQALHKMQIGALPWSGLVTASPGSHRYYVANSEVHGPYQQLLEVPRRTRPDGLAESLIVELRAPFGRYDNFAPGDPAVRGITVRLWVKRPAPYTTAKNWNKPDTYLIDTTPGSAAGDADFADAPLLPGRVFRDPLTGIVISDAGVGYGVAAVDVTRP